MRLEYLLERPYEEECKPIELYGGTLYLPPVTTGSFLVDEIVRECVQVQLRLQPDARIDDQGNFFTMRCAAARNTPLKHIHSEITSVPVILSCMRSVGYEIADDYWNKNRDQLKRTKR